MSEGLSDLTIRMREVFRLVVEDYLDRGAPVGSRAIAGGINLSPASVRGVMQALEERGLLTHPHTSAGRIPTESGLRLFVDGMMQAATPGEQERAAILKGIAEGPVEQALASVSQTLSGLSACAGVVTAPRLELRLRELRFVPLDHARALAVLVGMDGAVENRVVDVPAGTAPSALVEVGNFVTARMAGLTLGQAVERLRDENVARREAIHVAAAALVASGLARWSEDLDQRPVLIVKGAANLIDEAAAADLDRVKKLLEELEDAHEIARLLEGAHDGEGCRVFIGSENRMFALSGSSVIAAPYRGSDGRVIGVVGVIGPTRLNYARVVPMVDLTAQLLTRRMQ